jgi:hypothetical protein
MTSFSHQECVSTYTNAPAQANLYKFYPVYTVQYNSQPQVLRLALPSKTEVYAGKLINGKTAPTASTGGHSTLSSVYGLYCCCLVLG